MTVFVFIKLNALASDIPYIVMTVFVFIKLNALASDTPYIVMTVFVFIKLNALASDTPYIVMVCVFIKLNVLTTLLVEAHHTLCVNRI